MSSQIEVEELEGFRSLLFSIAYRMVGEVGDAEDIVQEAYLRAHRLLADGGEIREPKAFLAEVTRWFARHPPERCVLVGDLNIAPLEHDVWSHRQLLGVVCHTPVEVAAMDGWIGAGFVDAMRHFVPADEKLFTWWSYRNRDWRASNRGRRLDHIWVTPDLVSALRGLTVLAEQASEA